MPTDFAFVATELNDGTLWVVIAPDLKSRGQQLRPQARRSEQGSADRSYARLKLGRAADLWSGMTRDGKPWLVQAQNVEPGT